MSVEEKKRSNGAAKDEKGVEIHHKDFDLKNYIKDYRGNTKIKRLVFIGCRCPEVRLAAFRSAITELKKSRDIELYTETVAQAREYLGEKLGEEWGFDKAWVEKKRNEFNAKERGLADKIDTHRRDEDSHEEILAAYKALIAFLQESGHFREALIKIRDSQDFARTPTQKLYTRLAEVENAVQLDLNNSRIMMHVSYPKWTADLTREFGSLKSVQAKIHVINGLYSLQRGEFENAAHRFKLVSFDLNCPTVISKRDVAIYGTLCAMASFQRAQLQINLLKSGEFKKFMSLVPGLIDMVQDFVRCKFRKAFEFLERLKLDIQLDFHMAKHQEKIYEKIHELAVVQYFAPFSHARISRMAEVFGVTQNEMEGTLVTLIGRGAVSARIDNFNKVVIAKHFNARTETYKKSLEAGTSYVRDLKTLLMRMSLHANDFSIKHSEESSFKNPEMKRLHPEALEDVVPM